MNVIAIIPAFDFKINEMAMVWKELCANSDVKGIIVTSNKDVLKNTHSEVFYEQTDNLEIHRFTPPLKSHMPEILQLAEDMKPQLIFCGVSHNLPLAIKIQKKFNAPILLHNEFFSNPAKLINRRHYLGIKLLRPISYYFYSNWCLNTCASILCSDPTDFKNKATPPPQKLRYFPWPHPGEKKFTELAHRNINSAVYIGSLSKYKGAANLDRYYTHLLTEHPDIKLTLIGPALDEEAKNTIDSLRRFGQNRIDIRERCSRSEALEIIGQALFVLSPSDSMGWGLIGDAWGAGTPVISVSEHYDLTGGKNCIIANSPNEFLMAVKQLQQDNSFWNKLSNEGLITAQSHSLKNVAAILQHEITKLCSKTTTA